MTRAEFLAALKAADIALTQIYQNLFNVVDVDWGTDDWVFAIRENEESIVHLMAVLEESIKAAEAEGV
jgi:hypothetical protein